MEILIFLAVLGPLAIIIGFIFGSES